MSSGLMPLPIETLFKHLSQKIFSLHGTQSEFGCRALCARRPCCTTGVSRSIVIFLMGARVGISWRNQRQWVTYCFATITYSAPPRIYALSVTCRMLSILYVEYLFKLYLLIKKLKDNTISLNKIYSFDLINLVLRAPKLGQYWHGLYRYLQESLHVELCAVVFSLVVKCGSV